jgi:hypothetical protein
MIAKVFQLRGAMKRVQNAAADGSSNDIRSLRTSSFGLQKSIGLTLLGWGLFASLSLGDVCWNLMTQRRIEPVEVLLMIRAYAETLTITLLTVLALYLAHWYWFRKIEHFEQ